MRPVTRRKPKSASQPAELNSHLLPARCARHKGNLAAQNAARHPSDEKEPRTGGKRSTIGFLKSEVTFASLVIDSPLHFA